MNSIIENLFLFSLAHFSSDNIHLYKTEGVEV